MTAKKSQKGEHNIKKNKIKKCLTNKERNSIIQHDDFGKKKSKKGMDPWKLNSWKRTHNPSLFKNKI